MIKMNLKNMKSKLKYDTLDLSLCDLEEVPVRDIALVKKATTLDLSNNLLVALPKNFVILKQIVKLDLSKNMLTEIPENFGEMTQLKYLDLYANQISRLPLSLSELKNLRWLDLKENPLTAAVASVAGPCSNISECQACARNVVEYLCNVKSTIKEEKLRKINSTFSKDVEDNQDSITTKKEPKKKKKKKATDKEDKKSTNKIKPKMENEISDNANNLKKIEKILDKQRQSKIYTTTGSWGLTLCQAFTSIILWSMILVFLLISLIVILPIYNKEQSLILFNYIEAHTGILVNTYQKCTIDALQIISESITVWTNYVYKIVHHIYNKYAIRDVN